MRGQASVQCFAFWPSGASFTLAERSVVVLATSMELFKHLCAEGLPVLTDDMECILQCTRAPGWYHLSQLSEASACEFQRRSRGPGVRCSHQLK